MADATNIPVPPTESSTPSSPLKSGAGFLATSTGKLVAGGTTLLVLLVIVGASVMLLASGCSAGMFKSGGVKVTSTPGQPTGTTVVVAEAVPADPPSKPLTSSFTFRNVFAPSVKPPIGWIPKPTVVTPSSDSDTPSTPTSPSVAPVTTLTLDAIVKVGDAHEGQFKWNGAPYTAGNGETIDSSPWKVLEVIPPVDGSTGSCLMLYGDVQETITVGQTITK